MTVVIYTDGACKAEYAMVMNGNMAFPGRKSKVMDRVGKGGWAWWVDDHLWNSGAVPDTTNNRMEMLAVIEALKGMAIHRPYDRLLIVSDSAYVVNCFADGWYRKWLDNGWRNGAGKPVKNRDLWEALLGGFNAHQASVAFRHCRGHGRGGPGDAPYVHGNAQADHLAVQARKTLEGRSYDDPYPSDPLPMPDGMA